VETGSTPTITLDERSGCTRILSYGGYASSPISLCHAKDLTVP
jgi:hypothetical protein